MSQGGSSSMVGQGGSSSGMGQGGSNGVVQRSRVQGTGVVGVAGTGAVRVAGFRVQGR